MGFGSWYNAQKVGVQVAVVGGILTILGGVVAGGFGIVDLELAKPGAQPSNSALAPTFTSSAAQSVSPSPTQSGTGTFTCSPASTGTAQPRTAPSEEPSASLTYPADGTKMSREQGFTMGGIVTGSGADTIWILDHPAGACYYIDAEAAIKDGKWNALDRPLGGKSDHLPYSLRVVAVFATPECTTLLRHLESARDVRLGQLPSGCYQFGEVTVDVNRP